MKRQKTILHVIDSLGRGGAETLLAGYVKELVEFKHVVVYLNENNEFVKELAGIDVIKLGFSNKLLLPYHALRLFKIIRNYKVDLIHSHLYWSTIITRIANLNQLPHLFSIHNKINETVFLKHPYTKVLERLTYKNNQIGIAVSGAVKDDYVNAIKPSGEIRVLYNYIDDKFYRTNEFIPSPFVKQNLKLVAVGNLKSQKNYPYLIKAFSLLKDKPVTLDIYGAGPLYNELMDLIHELGVASSVSLKGAVANLETVLPEYDAFVMASTVEGFGLAPIEAMASGLPLILSDINVLKEVASRYAYYFNPYKINDFIIIINEILNKKIKLDQNVLEGIQYAIKFNRNSYLHQLSKFYNNIAK